MQFKKKKNIKFIWTNDGVTYLREFDGAKAMATKTEDDLVKYGFVKSSFFSNKYIFLTNLKKK